MSKIVIKSNDSGTGTFTIESPNSNTNRTLSLPDESGSVLSDVSDIAADKLTGDIAADRMKDGFSASGSAPVFACRAWVNFNGQGTVAIRASGNVSSITDNGVGDYTVNFATAMPDTDYSVSTTSDFDDWTWAASYATSSIDVYSYASNLLYRDVGTYCVSIFR